MSDNQDRLEVIKQGLPEQVRRDDWGGHFLTAEGEFGWPGSHIIWLITEVERLKVAKPGCLYHCECDRLTTENERLRAQNKILEARLDQILVLANLE